MPREPEREQETQGLDEELRPSRTAERRERKESEGALAKLSTELCALSERRLGGLGLPETAAIAIREARRIESPAARNRALRRVRQELRACDWTGVGARLRDDNRPRRPALPPKSEAVDTWSSLLIEEGDGAIDRLLTLYPGAERKTLRVLVRNLKQATPKTESRARAALQRWLEELLRVTLKVSPPLPAEQTEGEGAD